MKIKQVITILFVFLSVIPLTFLGITNMQINNQKLEHVLENDLRVAVSTQVKTIENFVEERKADATVIAAYGIVDDLLDKAALRDTVAWQQLRGYMDDLFRSRAETVRSVESITLLDKNFTIISCSEPGHHGEKSTLVQLDPKYFMPEMQFTDVIETNRDGSRKLVIAAIQAVYSSAGELRGYLVQEINLSFFEEVRASASLFNNGTIYLIDGKGQMIAAGDTQETRSHFELSPEERKDFERAWSERDKNSREGILKYTARGQHYLSCYSGFQTLDWTIISSINADEVLQTKRGYQELAFLILGVLVIMFLAQRFWLSRSIAAPIQKMIDQFRRIKETQDYSIRMENLPDNEFGIIAREINTLLSDIEHYIAYESQKQEQLREKAERDSLTGLLNKAAFAGRLQSALEQAQETQTRIAFLFLDIDDFKQFNTQYGHQGGDDVLRFVAGRLRACAGELTGRQGGDEFVACLCQQAQLSRIQSLLDGLLSTLHSGVLLINGEAPVPVHCSIGVALSDGTDTCIQDLMARADLAMYEVKHHGKNNYCIKE